MSKKIRILIAEDHERVREGLKLIVSRQENMDVVGEAGDGCEALRLAQELQPDIVLMDILMPNLNGLNAVVQLKKIAPEIKILTLTRHTDTAYLQEIIQAGGDGYLLKQNSTSELVRALQTVAGGNVYLDPAMNDQNYFSYSDWGKQSVLQDERPGVVLTERGSGVLRNVALGYSNQEIAGQLDISIKLVEDQKASAMQKLSMKKRREIIRYAILKGWMKE